MKIIDTHCHLNVDDFIDKEQYIKEALENNVSAIFNNGDSFESLSEIIKLKREFPDFCHAVLGIHPEYANKGDDYLFQSLKYIEEHLSEIDAIGEIGLDYHYDKSEETKKNQEKYFREQIRFAKKHNLPIVIHSRDASYDTYKIVVEENIKKIDLHCYSSSLEIAEEYLRYSDQVYFGIGGVITFKNAKTLVSVVNNISLNHLLTETDSPYLAPVPHRGEKNESKYLPLIIKKISEIKMMNQEEASNILYNNAKRFYNVR